MYGFKEALRQAIRTRKEWEMDQMKKMNIDPIELRLAGYDYLDEDMAFQKIMKQLDADIKKLDTTANNTPSTRKLTAVSKAYDRV
ncbi:MAG: hypothetical protein R2867_30000 [Caldilineaceae bacterium]